MIKLILSHRGTKWITLGWTAFIAENLVLSENREALVSAFGEDNFIRTYAGLSSIACGSIAYGYLVHGHRKGPLVHSFSSTRGGRGLILGLQALGLIGLSQSLPKLQIPIGLTSTATTAAIIPASESGLSSSPPPPAATPKFKILCPIDIAHAKSSNPNELGLNRVTRHPQLFSLGFLALGTALASPFLTCRILCGFPILFALIGGAHQDRRFERSGKYTREYLDQTSLIPFVALVTGKQEWEVLNKEMKWVNSGVGVVSALVLKWGRAG
ncbi:hypothetical protein BDR26DRAFT_851363 [Obelidium mucronatum]|nr:hypothetical protein BDR26DRAFT_851363 [Obelidium mucronatum]